MKRGTKGIDRSIAFDSESFILDGKRIFLHSGEMPYFRTPRSQWRDRLLKAKRGFLNCVSTYVPWNWHERREGEICFEGDRDVEEWIRIAQELGLFVIIRSGPFMR